jgi:hypothetical protein
MLPRRGEITNQMIDKLRAYLVAGKPPKPNTGGKQQAVSHSASDADGPVAENEKAFQKLIKESIE